MDFLVKFASAFMSVFQAGGTQFMGWVTGIIPTILMLLVMMNAIIALIGDERIEAIAKVCTSNPILRYAVLPWVSAFMLGNPMALSMGKFMPEFYKPSYYAAASYHCHTNSGIFPHINPSEIMIYLGIAQGITALGMDATPLDCIRTEAAGHPAEQRAQGKSVRQYQDCRPGKIQNAPGRIQNRLQDSRI